jgi:hypothetical protein
VVLQDKKMAAQQAKNPTPQKAAEPQAQTLKQRQAANKDALRAHQAVRHNRHGKRWHRELLPSFRILTFAIFRCACACVHWSSQSMERLKAFEQKVRRSTAAMLLGAAWDACSRGLCQPERSLHFPSCLFALVALFAFSVASAGSKGLRRRRAREGEIGFARHVLRRQQLGQRHDKDAAGAPATGRTRVARTTRTDQGSAVRQKEAALLPRRAIATPQHLSNSFVSIKKGLTTCPIHVILFLFRFSLLSD